MTLETTLERVPDQPFGVVVLAALRRALAEIDSIVNRADNAGETVFDRVLIENVAQPVDHLRCQWRTDYQRCHDGGRACRWVGEMTEIIDNGSIAPETPLEVLRRVSRTL